MKVSCWTRSICSEDNIVGLECKSVREYCDGEKKDRLYNIVVVLYGIRQDYFIDSLTL